MNMPAIQTAVTVYGSQSMNAAEMQLQINLLQDIMHKVMKNGTHFGTIPGTNAPTLYKPGAEKIMATFRLAADPVVDDLSQGGEVHYRVRLRILNSSGDFLGAGVGECSSREEKYAWRRALCKEEFESMPDILKRTKYQKYKGNVETVSQVRTNPADVANTILKMAKKRALIDAVLTVTAASDIFTQDIEDLPEELVAEITGREAPDESPLIAEWSNKIDKAVDTDDLRNIGKEMAGAKMNKASKEALRAIYSAKFAQLQEPAFPQGDDA
jgi:hypothetical protein